MNIVNPRIKNPNTWYSYYAGFSMDFVESVIEKLNIGSNSIILDPWNGSGTTTTVAFKRGIPSIGFDINPATITVAKSRLLHDIDINYIESQSKTIIEDTKSRNTEIKKDDMLLDWFPQETAYIIRNIERSISSNFKIENGLHINQLDRRISSITSFFYVALFCTAKHYLAECKSKNPTWTKSIRVDSIDAEDILNVFSAYLQKNYLAIPEAKAKTLFIPESRIECCPSQNLFLENETASYIITSPPYCTRIDYAVTTKIELAILGLSSSQFNKLRDQMIGTSTIHSSSYEINKCWGTEVTDLLEKIKMHSSYASLNYYYKTYWQYFNDSFSSLIELNRVLKNGGYAVIVVQDSYYKELHVDLAKIYTDMARNIGWTRIDTINFKKSNSMATINSKSHPDGKKQKRIETVLIFRK